MTKRDLVARAQAGDPAALSEIVRVEGPRVARLLGRILGPRQDMDDLVQNVFLEMCRALPRFKGKSKFSTFIGGITVRIARRALRPTAYDRTKTVLEEEPLSPAMSLDDQALLRERMRSLHRSLERLSDKKRIAIVLYAFEGMSVEEIAETMGATVFATRARIQYAKKELKKRAEREPYLRDLLEGGVS
jgi:RNA polymerase sigma-70 factor (ECF subfamily)